MAATRACERALAMGAAGDRRGGRRNPGLRGRGGAASRPASSGRPSLDAQADAEIHRLQRRRRRQRHLRRPHDHGRRSLRADRRHDDRRHRGRRDQGLHLYPLRISACDRGDERGDRDRAARPACSATSVAGSRMRFDLEVRVGAGAYVCGEETSLLESLEGKRGMVRAKPPLPAHQGPVRQADRHQQRALARRRCRSSWTRAPRSTRDFGMGRSRGTMPIQLAGNVKHGGLFETAFGLTLGELVDDIGGGTRDRPAGPRGAGRRAARRLFPARAVRHAVRLRGLRRAATG